MWGAIKSDLLSFVTTIQEDTTNTLNRVLGDDDDEVLLYSFIVINLHIKFSRYYKNRKRKILRYKRSLSLICEDLTRHTKQ